MFKLHDPEVCVAGCAHSLLVVLLVHFLDGLGGRDVALDINYVVSLLL